MNKNRKKKRKYRPLPTNTKVVPAIINGEDRFVIIDADTSEVWDDANGYGYKTARNAHAALSYRKRTPEQRAEAEKNERLVIDWCKSHRSLCNLIFELQLDAAKCREEFGAKDFKEVVEEQGVELPLEADVFWRLFLKV